MSTKPLPISGPRALAIAVLAALACLLLPSTEVAAQVCARVKIEIVQELTLERQAFDAHMKITNGLTHLAIEDLEIEVVFEDPAGEPVVATSDPNDETAMFFITLDQLEGVTAVDGTGTIQPDSVGDIHWLIIPAPGAAGPDPDGTLYFVGASVSYSLGGEAHSVSVVPDSIYVRPMPLLYMDYFLPEQVHSDNPYTTVVEPPVPFTLGVRVANHGYGPARSLKINSSQPKIVENEQGLLIAFEIIGSEVNGEEKTSSLLVDFGDIEPETAGTARWFMTSTLQGKFIEFTATFSHADELGGELTSLLEEVNTHFLVRDVLVDVTGRDALCDFLADDNGTLRVYESDLVDTEVFDASGASSIAQKEGLVYTVSVPPTAGFSYVRVTDPHSGAQSIVSAVRADGKEMHLQNVWLSRIWVKDSQSYLFYVNVFDALNPEGHSYDITFGEGAPVDLPPVIGPLPDRKVRVDETLSYTVSATDPDGEVVPTLGAHPLPAGAVFVDHGDATGTLTWTPTSGQLGSYPVDFDALDALFVSSATATIIVVPADETNQPPSEATANIVTKENTTSLPVTPAVVDPDPDDAHFFTLATPPTHGAAAVVDNQLVYTPQPDYTGLDEFTFEAMDLFGETVTGTASVIVTGDNDLTIAGFTIDEDGDGAPVEVSATLNNSGETATPVPVDVELWAETCAGAELLATESLVLEAGETLTTLSLAELANTALADEPVILRLVVDASDALPEPDEHNNQSARSLLLGTATADSTVLGHSGAAHRQVCTDEAMTVSQRTVYGLPSSGAASARCYDVLPAGATVAWVLTDLGTGETARSGEVLVDDHGAWHAELGMPPTAWSLYRFEATLHDGATTAVYQTQLTAVPCDDSVPPPMVQAPPFPGPNGEADIAGIVSFEDGVAGLPWLVHPGGAVPTVGEGTFGSATGSGATDQLVLNSPLLGATGGASADVDAEVLSLTLEPAAPKPGEVLTVRAVVDADDSIYGLPVAFSLTDPAGVPHAFAPTTWYYANGALHVAATFVPPLAGDYTVEVSLGDGWTDADPANDSLSIGADVANDVPMLDGLTLWLDASEGVTTDGAGGVSQWTDRSGEGTHATQDTDAARPLLGVDPAHGHQRLSFDGLDDQLDVAPAFDTLSDGFTAFLVAQPAPGAVDSVLLDLSDGTAASRVSLGWSGGQKAAALTIGSRTVTSAPTLSLEEPQLVAVTYRAASRQASFRAHGDGVGSGLLRAPIDTPRDANRLGGEFAGALSELLVFDRSLSGAEIIAVETYLADRWGLYHPTATWVADGYGAELQVLIHANRWSRARADAYEAWLVANPAAPIPGVGLDIWLRADAAEVGADDLVTSWPDQSTALLPNTGSQADASARPLLVADAAAGQAALHFDGSDAVDLPAGFIEHDAGVTVFAVARPTGPARWGTLFGLGGVGSDAFIALSRQGDGSGLAWRVGRRMVAGDAMLGAAGWRLLGAVHDPSGDAVVLAEGEPLAAGALPVPPAALRDDNAVGTSPWTGVGGFVGDVAELIVYRRALEPAERQAVELYLTERYGLYHADAAWIADGGYDAETEAAIHAWKWDKATADDYLGWLAANVDAAIPGEGLQLWLRADGGVTSDAGVVSGWTGSGPAGHAAVPAGEVALSSTDPPVLLLADGDGIALPDGFAHWGAGLSAFVVARPDADIPHPGLLGFGPDAPAASITLGAGSDAQALAYGLGPATTTAPDTLRARRWAVASVVHGADESVTLAHDGQVVASGTAALPATTLRQGNTLGSFRGALAEVIVYSRSLDAAEQAQVALYLANKWGTYHADATWIADGLYSPELVDAIHAARWSLEEADAHADFVATHAGTPMPGMGLAMWLRADDAGVPAGALGTWSDLAPEPAVSDGAQSNLDAQPTLVEDVLEGHAVVRFDGDDDVLELPPGLDGLQGGFTMYAVAKPTEQGRWAHLFEFEGPTPGHRLALLRQATSANAQVDVGVEPVTAPDGLGSDAWRLIGVVQSATGQLTFRDHGEITATATVALPAKGLRTTNLVGHGATETAAGFAGDLAELMLWRRPLAPGELDALEVHLADRYGLYHSEATWIDSGGYAAELVGLIHAKRWNKGAADAAAQE